MKKSYLLILLISIAFTAKSQMQFSWAQSYNGSSNQIPSSKVAGDAYGNVYITGSFSGTRSFGSITLTAAGTTDAFIAKYDNQGNCIWAQKYGYSISLTNGSNLTVDANGNPIIVGTFTSIFNIDTSYYIALGQTDIFMLKLDPLGNVLLKEVAGGTSTDAVNAVTTDPQGNIYMAGAFGFKIYFDNDSLMTANASSLTDIFLTKYSPSGVVQWAKKAGGTSDNDAARAVQYRNGRIYMSGVLIGSCQFGTNNINGTGATDAFIAKYDLSGNNLWVKKAGGTANDYCNALSTDSFGNAYIAGSFILSATFGSPPSSFTLNAGNAEDAFIAKYDSMGVCKYAKKGGSGTGSDGGIAVASDAFGYTVMAGTFAGNASFAPFNLTASGLNDGFVTKYDPAGICQYALKVGSSGDDRGTGVCLLPATNQYIVVGNYGGTATFTGGLTLTPPAAFASFISSIPGFYAGIESPQVSLVSNLAYPNPATDFINVKAEYLKEATSISLVDILGQQVYTTSQFNNFEDYKLNAKGYSTGIYTLKIEYKDAIKVMKFQINQ